MKRLILLSFLFFSIFTQAQNTFIKGIVYGTNQDGKKEILVGANLVWLNTQQGATTNAEGKFKLVKSNVTDSITVSYIGYQIDTISVGDKLEIEINLVSGVKLASTEIVYHQKSTVVGYSSTVHTENLGHGELNKAACCNLSESFETSPTVDVSFADAITGAKQIRMLGLAGPYSQLTRENMPDIRGLSAVNGMEFIPGTWIDGIQLIKGAGSVVNGYESIAGQINTELQRAAVMPNLFLNFYLNNDRQYEGNVQFKLPIGKHWQNAVFIHGKYGNFRRDMNKDGFADKPATNRIIVMDRVEWINDKNIHFEIGGRMIYHDQLAGQMDFNSEQIIDSLHPWGMTSTIKKADVWTKLGKVRALKPWNSTAIQISASYYDQEAIYGLNSYSGIEKTFYVNALQKGRIVNAKHEYTVGTSLLYDDFNEKFNKDTFLREEIVPGIFGEYSFKPSRKFTLVGGFRADYHNNYGLFLTPRLHSRVEITPKTIMRFSAGRGFRTSNIFSEHLSMLASSRQIFIHGDASGYGYGLQPEIAWNYGVNLTQNFELAYREGVVGASFYRTDFVNQIVYDIDKNYREVHFYNLSGASFANSFQFQIDYELVKRLDVRLAYRYYDVQTTFSDGLQDIPLISKHRGFINLAYKTRNNWKFDATFNWVGQKRIPINISTLEPVNYSPSYLLINAQISKSWNDKVDVYVGVENLTNYRQDNPILNSENPYQDGFDASLIWGPIWGQHIYAGIKWKFNK